METIKTKAPLRITFAGGGTDIEPYCSEYGGVGLSATIKIYAQAVYPCLHKDESLMEEIIVQYLGHRGMVQIKNGAPPMSGLGGSAACFVAGIKAVNPDLRKEDIAKLAFHLERNVMEVAGGKQDQYATAYGGLNYMTFDGNKVDIEKIEPPAGLADSLILVHMGARRLNGADLLLDWLRRLEKKTNIMSFHQQKEIAKAMRGCLKQGDLVGLGRLLHRAWEVKQEFSPLIANEKIKEFYNNALGWGAIGGKLTGAGGGGYMLLMEDPNQRGLLRGNLSDREIPYLDVHFDTEGVTLV